MRKKYKILYVDDEAINLRIFKDSFRRDFEVLLANSALEALEILGETDVDVVITDQKMPNMTGVELLEKINNKYPDIPPNRLILSGYSANADIKKAFDHYKLFKFISKPWEYDELKNIIINAIKINQL